MKVTANVLLNYIRCRRYASLNDPDYDDINLGENLAANKYFQNFRDQFIKLYLDKYNAFDESVTLSYDFHPDVELYGIYDFFVKEVNQNIAFCLIPNSSKDFLKLKFTKDKNKIHLFNKNDFGAYEAIINKDNEDSNYQDKIQKITDRRDDMGRIVYKYAFKQFVHHIINPDTEFKLIFVLLNSDYVYDGEEYQKNIFDLFDFSNLFKQMEEVVEADIYRMINHVELNDFTACTLIKKECRKADTFECKFIDFCFSHIPKTNSVLDYFDSHRGFTEILEEGDLHHDVYELINSGYVDMLDIPISWLDDEKHLMQRYCTESDFIHVHKDKIEKILKSLTYPLIYLDFEALPCVLPRFKGETPFTQSVFQYSIHIEKEEGKLGKNGIDHFEFIANPEFDNRRDLIESMIKIINKYKSSVIVYHKTFEEQRLKEMQNIFPEYSGEIQKIIDRIFDLKDVLKNNKKFFINNGFSDYEASRYNLYSSKMSGSYSLKKVIKVFNENAYENLNIQDGVQAYKTYMKLKDMEPTDRDNAIKDLLEYCKQDTYSMFEIINGLKKYLRPGFEIQ